MPSVSVSVGVVVSVGRTIACKMSMCMCGHKERMDAFTSVYANADRFASECECMYTKLNG